MNYTQIAGAPADEPPSGAGCKIARLLNNAKITGDLDQAAGLTTAE
jgi:hypothetical protein